MGKLPDQLEGSLHWKALYTEQLDFPPSAAFRERAARMGLELEFTPGYSESEIIEKGADCDVIFLFHAEIDREVVAQLSACQVLARVGTGYDLIDVEAARSAGVMVTYVPDFCSEELSDTVMMFILALSRQLPSQWLAAMDHRWLSVGEAPMGERLIGKTLGILGFGHSGRRTAAKARPFGFDVRVWTRTHRPSINAEYEVEAVGFAEVLSCDFISLHLPSTADTRGMIGDDAFAAMKPGARLINVARGDLVDTAALCRALTMGQLGGVGLDVVDPEPLPSEHPLWDLPNVIITPHTAALSEESLEISGLTALEDAVAVLEGRPPQHPVPEMRLP